MADLSSIDPTTPIATALVSEGDDQIRALKDQLKTSFEIEHNLAGPHQFFVGGDSTRGAAAYAGRLYINTEHNRLERDTGSVWGQANAVTLGVDSGLVTLSTSWQTVCTVSINVITNGRLLCLGTTQWASAVGSEVIQQRIQVAGTNIASAGSLTQTIIAGAAFSTTIIGYDVSPSAGTLSITLDALGSTGGQNIDADLIVCVI